MPMSWIPSFAVLNAVNAMAFEEAFRINPDAERKRGFGFGDDLIASASTRKFVSDVNQIREDLGLTANTHATGYFHPTLLSEDESALGVFCEVLYDLRTGRVLHPPKTRAYLSLANASAPQEFIHPVEAYLPDVRDIHRFMRRANPEYLEVMRQESPQVQRPFRTTYPRALLRATLARAVVPFEAVLSPGDAKEFFALLEPFILPVAPSTRGVPHRIEGDVRSRAPLIGVRSASRIAKLIGVNPGNWRQIDVEEFIIDSRPSDVNLHPYYAEKEEWVGLGLSPAHFLARGAANAIDDTPLDPAVSLI